MKNKVIVFLISVFFLILSLWNIFGQKVVFSESERRVLAKFPVFDAENVMSGDFSDEFEDYAVDHFQARDAWRGVKAYAKTNIFMQKDNNGLFAVDGHLCKLEYPMNTKMLDYAIEVFGSVKEQYLSENEAGEINFYLAVVPDKNRYLARENGYLSMDYELFSEYMAEEMEYASYIEIADLLEVDDYYTTDSHWRQEKVVDVAERLGSAMGADIMTEYEEQEIETPFYGVYAGQSALSCEPDTIAYLSNEVIDCLEVEGADAVYDVKKAKERDPYEMFLSGNQPIVTVTNPKCTNEKRLILFRDSFGSSIAPLLATGYAEVTLVDLRYISSESLGEFVNFENADIVFLYSTMLLNHSMALK